VLPVRSSLKREIRILAAILCNEGLVLAVIGIIGLVEGFRLNRISAAAEEAYGPGWYLVILSLIIIVCSFFYLVSTFRRPVAKRETKFSLYRSDSTCIALVVLYGLMLPYIGYFTSTVVFLFMATRIFGEQSWVRSTLLAGISGAVLYLVFIHLAEIPMP
jgi:hypothetical protein